MWHIAKSVSKWTWQKFDLAASDARFSQLQAHRSKQQAYADKLTAQQAATQAAAKARLQASEDKRTSARLMAAAGQSIRAIAAELGVGKSTVARWLSEVSHSLP